ncbi:hypothetical protein G7B40_040670 [Aetokthonos hydrillicola Thurmond2011]|uniref:Uncharacterized protein n=1 Tax=Aetokthonos hydrillicola Thurmond2011 TaxID=2712845 RepID=A0AAP5IH80_9CYAN|nr:hypothetical protein [Aetokthonos hydrillicola]MBO3460996.1 hypothetical protein [Aetokthonos hydrillicola CCALA 1050]MBW4588435.1 hypothetical protein [Aetokthonos hydrillicola CCALA 1050]MDR9900804.1 hypothetical protein [Aetokthonos hydrillicola Thurmond2011]
MLSHRVGQLTGVDTEPVTLGVEEIKVASPLPLNTQPVAVLKDISGVAKVPLAHAGQGLDRDLTSQ